MENLLEIINDIKEKKGKDWLGIQPSSEKQLDTLRRYLENPDLQKNQRIVEDIVKIYYEAKASGFIRMEYIVRKLDELSIKYGKAIVPAEMEKEDLAPNICRSCGNENRVSAKYCDNCGLKLEN